MAKCKNKCKEKCNHNYIYDAENQVIIENLQEELTKTFTSNPTKEEVAQQRKATPVFSGVLKYFPNAIKAVAQCSQAGNDQHHPDKPLHWDMSKSTDELDALTRHLIDHSVSPVDTDGILHLSKVAWRSLAALERYLIGEDV